jgi:rubrerythrin
MEKERMSREDYLRCDRVWQRVAPELDPYPEVRAAAGQQELRCAPAMESGLSCPVGGAAAERLADFIAHELSDRQTYLHHMRCAPQGARRVLRQIVEEEGAHARRLAGLYYLMTGTCYRPPLCAGGRETMPWCGFLRLRYHAECSGAEDYRAAAEAARDGCTKAIFRHLAEDEQRHAQLVLQLLEGNLPTPLA